MMRALFLLLVLANAALFLWLQRQTPEAPVPPPATEAGIAPLRLLSEIPPTAAAAEDAPQPPPAASATPEQAATIEPLLKAVPDAAPAAANGNAAAKPDTKPEPRPAPKPIAVPRIQAVLVPAAPQPAATPATPQIIAPESPPAPALDTGVAGIAAADTRCYTAGPFMQPAEAAAFAAQLAARGLRADTRVSDKKEEAGYWVYLPPYPSAEAARAVTAELAAKGEKEYFILRPGDPQANAISLGVFRDRKLAERRHAKLRGMGYPAELSIRYRDSPVSWVDFSVAEGALPPERLSLPAGAQRHARSCGTPSRHGQ